MQIAVLVLVAIILFVVLTRKEQKPDDVVKPELPKNNPPVAHEGLVYGGALSDTLYVGDSVKIDMRHRIHGCDADGNPLFETGAYDPEGDVVEYCVECTGPGRDGVMMPYSVFTNQGVKCDTGWIPNGSPNGFSLAPKGPFSDTLEPQAMVTFIVGHRGADTPYPFASKGCATPEPTPVPVNENKLGECVFTYTVRDKKGAEASASLVWPVYDGCKK